jgi:D-alanyl-D-alanine carboxypeptidase/D-alanyl-D-alanine-endopeptidase (penicillin-binding protein 4)
MMRAFLGAWAVAAFLLVSVPLDAAAATSRALRAAQSTLRRSLATSVSAAGPASGAYVVDLTTGRALFAAADRVGRLPASVEKIYTTSTALLRFGPSANLTTRLLGQGSLDTAGTWRGTLYLQGGGDPTFGSASFDQNAYGTGATVQRVVSNLIRDSGIKALRGTVVGDESFFDAFRGTAPYGFQTATDIGGPLSALSYNRGLADEQGNSLQDQPPLFAAQQLVFALRSAGVSVPPGTPTGSGATPADATELAVVNSPRLATLIRMTNVPSDNFFAEMLLKVLGARFGGGGSSAAGATVVRGQLAVFGVHARVEDGSGLSRRDVTSPRQVVMVLRAMASNPDFVSSLAVAGRTGTLASRMRGTAAAGRCRGKTGTLHDVSDLAGYCTARDGHTLAFAFLMNSVDPPSARGLQDSMTVALARYNG